MYTLDHTEIHRDKMNLVSGASSKRRQIDIIIPKVSSDRSHIKIIKRYNSFNGNLEGFLGKFSMSNHGVTF